MRTRVLLVLAAIPLLVMAAMVFLKNEPASASFKRENNVAPQLELRVDPQNHARIFCKGFKVIAGLGDYFDFYERNISVGRKSIFEGPWNGRLRELAPGSYSITGVDHDSGTEYKVSVRQLDQWTVELNLSFKSPARTANLGFDIGKLTPDLFKGGGLTAAPSSLLDATEIPVEPRSFARRMLVSDKNRILIRGFLCDIEVVDITQRMSVYAADGRNVPWDRLKSLIISGGASTLEPGSQQSFRYTIRSMPPSLSVPGAGTAALGKPVADINPWSFFNTSPKSQTRVAGSFRLHADDRIYGSPSGTAEAMLSRELFRMTGLQLNVNSTGEKSSSRGVVIERVSRTLRPDIKADGFEIITSSAQVIVRGIDERGCLYGVYSLLGRLALKNGVWELDSGKILDWPDLPVRGGCISLLKPAIRDVGVMKRYLDAYSRARSNVVVFLHEPKQILAWRDGRDDGGWTKQQMSEIANYARWLHMDVWGGMGSAFSINDFPEFEIRSDSNIYNPFNDNNYRKLYSLFDEILKAYNPTTFLISHDEIKGLSIYAAESGISQSDIFAADVTRIHDWLATRKVQTAVWGDMLLDYEIWEKKVGSAHSNSQAFRSGPTHLALKKLPKDIIILDWHYGEKGSYESIKNFSCYGFKVAGISWHDPKAAKLFAESVSEFGGEGLISSDWGFWATMSPASTTLYAPLCSWSRQCRIDELNTDVNALAETVRDPIYSGIFRSHIPISIQSAANQTTHSVTGGQAQTIFGLGQFLDLSSLKLDRQMLGDVKFDLALDGKVQENNVVVVSNTNQYSSKKSRFLAVSTGSIKADSIAFLHTAFVEEPSTAVRKLGRYLVEYESGVTEAVDILDNWNITDVRSSEGLRKNVWSFLRSPDVLIGSKPAWRGRSASGIPLNLQLYIWRNPHPDTKIKIIKIETSKEAKGVNIALVGLTFLR